MIIKQWRNFFYKKAIIGDRFIYSVIVLLQQIEQFATDSENKEVTLSTVYNPIDATLYIPCYKYIMLVMYVY